MAKHSKLQKTALAASTFLALASVHFNGNAQADSATVTIPALSLPPPVISLQLMPMVPEVIQLEPCYWALFNLPMLQQHQAH
jgi:hypothetical protein